MGMRIWFCVHALGCFCGTAYFGVGGFCVHCSALLCIVLSALTRTVQRSRPFPPFQRRGDSGHRDQARWEGIAWHGRRGRDEATGCIIAVTSTVSAVTINLPARHFHPSHQSHRLEIPPFRFLARLENTYTAAGSSLQVPALQVPELQRAGYNAEAEAGVDAEAEADAEVR